MGLLDAFKKAQKVAEEHPEQVAVGIHKLEGAVEHETGGRYDGQIRAAGDKLERALGVPKHRGEAHEEQEGERPAPHQES